MRLGAYDLVSELGRGAMGVVWRARHRPTRTDRAVKVIELDRTDYEAFVRFQREAEALARVDGHPNIVRVHETGVEGKRAFYAMELVDGRSLRDRITEGPLPVREAVALIAKVSRAIAHCHAQGVIHRDLKPENVLIDREGEPRLVDFGLVRDLGAQKLTHTGSFLGTPAYMSPEQVRGETATWATDVHGLGLILYEALSGERAYQGAKVIEIAQAVLEGKVVPLERRRPDIPVSVARIVGRALTPAPTARPPAAELAKDLEHVAKVLRGGGKVVAAGEIRAFARTLKALGAVAILLAVALLVVLLRPRRDPQADARRAIDTLGEVARASLGTSDVEAHLAARAAVELADATSASISWETLAAGAQAALARGADFETAAALSSRALAAAPSERRDELLFARARGLLGAGDTERALEDLRALASPDAVRVRARVLLGARRFEELAALPGDEGFVQAARAAAQALIGKKRPESVRQQLGTHVELLALLAEKEAIAIVDEKATAAERDFQNFAADAVNTPDVHVKPFQRAALCFAAVVDSPRWVDRAANLRALDRALEVIEKAPLTFFPSLAGSTEATGRVKVTEDLTRDLEKAAMSLAGAEPLDALTHRIRASRILDFLQRNDRQGDGARAEFLEQSLGKAPRGVEARLRSTIARLRELKLIRGEADAKELLEFVEATLPLFAEEVKTWDDTNPRAGLEALAVDLIVRLLGEQDAETRKLSLEKARRHYAILRRADGLGRTQPRDRRRCEVEIAIAAGDLVAAERGAAEFTRNDPYPFESYLVGELLRLRGEPEKARPHLEAASRSSEVDVASAWFVLDVKLSLALVDRARGDANATSRIERLWSGHKASAPVLPWIRDAVREVLGQ